MTDRFFDRERTLDSIRDATDDERVAAARYLARVAPDLRPYLGGELTPRVGAR